MIIVNRFWLDDIWASIGEGADTRKIHFVDMSSLENVRVLAHSYMIPYFNSLPQGIIYALKATWRYGIQFYDDEQLESSIDSVLPPFVVPEHVKEFYINVWKSTFPGEVWVIDDAGTQWRDLYNPNLSVWEYTK